MGDFEELLADKRGDAVSSMDVVRYLLEAMTDGTVKPQIFRDMDAGIQELSVRHKRYGKLPEEEKKRLYVEAAQILPTLPTPPAAPKSYGKFIDLILTGVGIFGMAVDAVRDPTSLIGVGQDLFGPHPNMPRRSQGSGSALLGSENTEIIEKIVGKVEELMGRVSKLEGTDQPAPPPQSGVPLPGSTQSLPEPPID